MLADFYKFFKCRHFNKKSRTYAENLCEYGEIIETSNLIRLLIFDDKSLFLFSEPVPKHQISLVYNLLYFLSLLFNNFKKPDSENVPTQIHDFYVDILNVYMSQMNPNLSTTLHTQFNYFT